jgi:hypothetical protein
MNRKQKTSIDPEDLHRTIYRPCRFATAQTTDNFAEQASGHLVQLALVELGRGQHSLGRVCDKIRTNFRLFFESYEVGSICQRLAQRGFVEWEEAAQTVSLPLSAARG